ncbi:MAG: RING finger protein [Aggregatilineales bacterium]
MPLLTFQNADGSLSEYAFSDSELITLRLHENGSPQLGVGESKPQAIITRAKVYQVPVVVNLSANSCVRVNGRRVVTLRVLRQGSRLQIGDLELTFWEMTLQDVAAGSALIRKRCPVCRLAFNVGDAVVVCPRCGVPHHKECWFEHEFCSNPGCLYPIRTTLKRLLAARGVVVEQLAANSPLVAQGARCLAGTPGIDAQPFRAGQHVVYCPNRSCNAAFHLECWVSLTNCPACNKYDVSKLLRSIFMPNTPPYFGEESLEPAEEAEL